MCCGCSGSLNRSPTLARRVLREGAAPTGEAYQRSARKPETPCVSPVVSGISYGVSILRIGRMWGGCSFVRERDCDLVKCRGTDMIRSLHLLDMCLALDTHDHRDLRRTLSLMARAPSEARTTPRVNKLNTLTLTRTRTVAPLLATPRMPCPTLVCTHAAEHWIHRLPCRLGFCWQQRLLLTLLRTFADRQRAGRSSHRGRPSL